MTPLTPRERAVILLVAEGCTDKEIAGRLGISRHAVTDCQAVIRYKLGAVNRTQAAVIFVRCHPAP